MQNSTTIAPLPPHLFSEFTVTVETAQELGLRADEFDLICQKLGRIPTYTELGIFSVMWSEHCSYKNSILELKKLPRSGGRMLVEAGEENAGLIDIGTNPETGKHYALAFKIESHNHPSAIEPVQGAATGVGGILRDIFTMGARPVAALNSLRFGNLGNNSTNESAARIKFLVKGVVAGISHYGNAFGVPTVGGEVYFDDCYTDNPLVNAMAVGIVEVGKTASAVADGVGNPVFILGSRTGRDGIHGASMASKDFADAPENMRPTVQVGDPFAEKTLLEATLELIESGVVAGMQDMGAAGICCSTSEMSAKSGTGMRVNLDLVPLREDGMSAYEIMLSESQERMLVVVKKGQEQEAKRICDKWDVPMTEIGEVTDDGILRVFRDGKQVMELPARVLVLGGEAPVYEREWRIAEYADSVQNADLNALASNTNLSHEEAFWKLLASPTIASKRWIYEQYDAEVGANTVLRANADAAVIRLKELPGKAIAMTTDCNSRYVYANPYIGGCIAVAEAARNVACTGAEPVAITNCLNFGNPYNPEIYWQFREALRGMGDACRTLGTPVTGGNVSFHNESKAAVKQGKPAKTIFPTPTIGMIGLIDDVSTVVGNGFTTLGDAILLLEAQEHLKNSGLGASEYAKIVWGNEAGAEKEGTGKVWTGAIIGDAPHIDLDAEKRLQACIIKAIRARLVHSAHDTAEGGLAIALAEKAINASKDGVPANFGAEISLQEVNTAGISAAVLFGEIQSRIIISLSGENIAQIQQICASYGIRATRIGTVKESVFSIQNVLSTSVETLRNEYEGALPALMR